MKLRVGTVRGLLDRLVFLLLEEQARCGVTEDPDRGPLPQDMFTYFAAVLERVFARQFTPTQAWALWRIVFGAAAALQAETRDLADVGFWYGLNPYRLTRRQRLALRLNLGRVKAQHVLQMGNYDAMDYKGVYNLVMLATGDDRQAVAARAEAIERAMNFKKPRVYNGE